MTRPIRQRGVTSTKDTGVTSTKDTGHRAGRTSNKPTGQSTRPTGQSTSSMKTSTTSGLSGEHRNGQALTPDAEALRRLRISKGMRGKNRRAKSAAWRARIAEGQRRAWARRKALADASKEVPGGE